MNDSPANGYQLNDSLQFKCDVDVLARSLASLHLLRLQWAPWESKWVDSLDSCNSDAEYDTDLEEAAAAYGLDDDDPSAMVCGRLSQLGLDLRMIRFSASI